MSVTPMNKHSFINFLRGLAIFLMLWGHSIQCCCNSQFDFFNNFMFKLIYAFHMPFFMLISGYLFFFSEKKRELVELVEYKAKNLLYPILMCSIVKLLLTKGVYSVLRGGYSGLIGGVPITSLWFLWSVLACSMSMAFVAKLSRKIIIQTLLIVVGIPFVALFPNWEMNLYMYPYFVIGYLYAKNEEKLSKAKNLFGFVCTSAFVVMMFFFEKKHYIYTSGLLGAETKLESLYIDFFRWAIGLFGSVAVVWVCGLLYGAVEKGRITEAIENLGKDSLAAYALSVSLLSYWLPQFADKLLSILTWIDWNSYIWLYNLIITPIVAVCYAALLLLIIKGLKKLGAYRLIFGR